MTEINTELVLKKNSLSEHLINWHNSLISRESSKILISKGAQMYVRKDTGGVGIIMQMPDDCIVWPFTEDLAKALVRHFMIVKQHKERYFMFAGDLKDIGPCVISSVKVQNDSTYKDCSILKLDLDKLKKPPFFVKEIFYTDADKAVQSDK